LKTIWITGAGGLIGSHLLKSAPGSDSGIRTIGLTREDLDLLDFAKLRARFQKERPDLVIHCAALSRTPDCEAQPELARKLNVELTAVLSELSRSIPFIFFSSDLVFDGLKGNYKETDKPNPLNVYAATKADAERIVLANSRHTVVRSSLNAGTSPTHNKGFNEQMLRAWARRETLKLFVDEFRSPIPAEVTASVIWELALSNCPGLYHLGGTERLSRFEIGTALAEKWPELKPKIEQAFSRDYPTPPRPPDTSLDCTKIQSVLSFELPAFRQWLADNPRI
jgi:dTDP-4-dehydrorhamnose reductase